MPSRRPVAAALALPRGAGGLRRTRPGNGLAGARCGHGDRLGPGPRRRLGRGDCLFRDRGCRTARSSIRTTRRSASASRPTRRASAASTPRPHRRAGPDGFVFAGFQGCDQTSGRTCTVDRHVEPTCDGRFRRRLRPSVALDGTAGGPVRGTFTVAASASTTAVYRVDSWRTAPWSAATRLRRSSLSVTRRLSPTGPDDRCTRRRPCRPPLVRVQPLVTVDNTVPVLGVTGPDGATFGPGSTQTWTLTASDVTSGRHPQLRRRASRHGPTFGACSGGASHQVTGLPGVVRLHRPSGRRGRQHHERRPGVLDRRDPSDQHDRDRTLVRQRDDLADRHVHHDGERAGIDFECRAYPFGRLRRPSGSVPGGSSTS